MNKQICLRCNQKMKLCYLNCGDFKITLREKSKKDLKNLFGFSENFSGIDAYVCLNCGHIELFAINLIRDREV